MFKIVNIFFAILFLLFSNSLFVITGKEIMQTQKDRQKTKNESSIEQMMLVNSDGSKEIRQVTRRIKDVGNDLHKALITFLSPADIKGTALLTWEQKDREMTNGFICLVYEKCKELQKVARKIILWGPILHMKI
ncbi:MAG: outer membrane lipoprotein-sorting protein [Deferribacterales bacterium]